MTLFELMIVLVIAVVLVFLAWTATKPAVIKSKVSKVRQDHSVLSRALSNYLVDFGVVPPALNALDVAMLAAPRDPFQKRASAYLYIPSPSPEMPSLLVSTGPDGDFDLPPELMRYASVIGVAPETIPGRRVNSSLQSHSGLPHGDPDALLATIQTYIYMGSFDQTSGTGGDIITVVR